MSRQPDNNQWGYLLKLQEERFKQEEREAKFQESLRRKQYKQQLEIMINNQNSRSRNDKAMDVELIRQAQKSSLIIQRQEKAYQDKLQKIRQQFAQENKQAKIEQIKRTEQQKQNDHKVFEEYLRKQAETIQRLQSAQKQHRLRQKTELASAYERQIHEHQDWRKRVKQQDKSYSEQQRLLGDTLQQQRRETLNKIRYGYNQNPEAYNLYSEIRKKKQSEATNVLSQVVEPEVVARTPHSLFQSPIKTQLQATNDELEEVRRKIQASPGDQRLRELEKKLQFRRQLQMQIQERDAERINEKRMDGTEAKINRAVFTGSLLLPGISNDYEKQKQRNILNSAFGVKQRMKTLDSRADAYQS